MVVALAVLVAVAPVLMVAVLVAVLVDTVVLVVPGRVVMLAQVVQVTGEEEAEEAQLLIIPPLAQGEVELVYLVKVLMVPREDQVVAVEVLDPPDLQVAILIYLQQAGQVAHTVAVAVADAVIIIGK